jgi:hypothetical protein
LTFREASPKGTFSNELHLSFVDEPWRWPGVISLV